MTYMNKLGIAGKTTHSINAHYLRKQSGKLARTKWTIWQHAVDTLCDHELYLDRWRIKERLVATGAIF
jgi:hypothetical protein